MTPFEAAEFNVRRALPQASEQFIHNLLYLAQGYSLHRFRLPLFLNMLAPVAGGVHIDQEEPSDRAEQCASRADVDAVIREVLAEFSAQSDRS